MKSLDKKEFIQEITLNVCSKINEVNFSIVDVDDSGGFDNLIVYLQSKLFNLRILQHRGEVDFEIGFNTKKKNEIKWLNLKQFFDYMNASSNYNVNINISESDYNIIKKYEYQKYEIAKNSILLKNNIESIISFISKEKEEKIIDGMKKFINNFEKTFFDSIAKK